MDGRSSMQPLEDAPPRPPIVAAAAGNQNLADQRGAPEGTGESAYTGEENSGLRPLRAMGSRQRAAQRRAKGKQPIEAIPPTMAPPRGNPDKSVQADHGSVRGEGDLRDRLNAKRAEQEPRIDSALSTEEARAIMERVASLEQKLTGDVSGLKKDIGNVAKVVNVDISTGGVGTHPFTPEVMAAPLAERYEAPAIALYNGTTDPDDHLQRFAGHMILHGFSEAVMCRAFVNHLDDVALQWFNSLKPNSISSWQELKKAFSLQFVGLKRYVPPKQNLTMLYQRRDESLKDWLRRFGGAAAGTVGITDKEVLMGALASMRRDSPFKRDLNRKPPESYQEFLARAQGFINGEEAELNYPGPGASRGKGDADPPAPRQDSRKRRSSGSSGPTTPARKVAEGKQPRQENYQRPRMAQRFDTYHELTVGAEEVFNQVGRKNMLRRPEPMRSDPNRRNSSKYCRFHGQTGHDTNDCADLRDEIERLVREGKLQEFRADRRNQARRGGNRRVQGGRHNDDEEPLGRIQTIHGGPYIGGSSRRAQKDYAHEAKQVYKERFWNLSSTRPSKAPRLDGSEIVFTEDDASGVHFPHNDALVVEAMVGSHTVCRILIDNGSSVDILYSDCLNKMGITEKELEKTTRPLYGFTGDSVVPMGMIKLPVKAGDKPRQATVMANFVVIKGTSQYNAVIGRPTLQALKAVTSIYHQKVKFPTPNGVGEMKGHQYESRVAYSDAMREYDQPGRAEMRMVNLGPADEDIDPRIDEGTGTQPVEDMEEVKVDEKEPSRTLKMGSTLAHAQKEELKRVLKRNLDVFAWTHADLTGIDRRVACHSLNVDPQHPPKRQKRRPMNPERYEALKEEVDKLIKNGFVREAQYPVWISNPVLVQKPNGKWRTCVDFSDLNKACPKDSFPLPRIDQLVDATAGHEIMSFMDAYSGYNQIPMHAADEEHTSFITDRGLYCYKVMPFGLKNAGATYQRLVNKMFAGQIGKTMEVYVDDMLVKSSRVEQHAAHLEEMFEILREYRMKLNPLKCAFGVGSGKFLGFMVSQRGIEANPEKIQALLDMRSPAKPKEVQKLTGCVAALNRFISKATDKCIPFFDVLKGNKRFEWTPACEEAFRRLKEHLGKPPLLSKPKAEEVLTLYLAVSEHAVSSVLVREEDKAMLPVYYVSKRLLDAETRYPDMEKLALSLMVASRKLRHYFHAHTIRILTNHPLRQAMQKPETSGRLLKWSVELSQFDIEYAPRVAIKGQALADFVAEFSHRPAAAEIEHEGTAWKLFVDGSSNESGSGAGILLISPEGHQVPAAIRFKFKASNNEAEYEALIAGVRLAKHLKVEDVAIYSDSQLVVAQVKDEFQVRGERMGAYVRKAREELTGFKRYEIQRVSRAENVNADALARLASAKELEVLGVVPIEELERRSIDEERLGVVLATHSAENWMTPIIKYLMDAELPADRHEARKIRYRAARYILYDGLLYRRGYSTPLQRCVDSDEGHQILREIHEGVCGNHAGGESLALKVLRQGYYWPTIKKDAYQYVRRCDKCQKYAIIPRAPPENLCPILSPWPFAKWGIDLIGPLHVAPGGFKWAIVAVDYYTKWAEAKALTTTTEAICTSFMWKNIVCRFGVPHSIVSDNGRQFDNAATRKFCEDLGIHKDFSSPIHPQSNGQVEAVNKILKYTLKKRLDDLKGRWAEELPNVLWAYRTTSRTTTGETPFSLTYGTEAVLPIEIETPTLRVATYREEENAEAMDAALDLVEERRMDSQLRLAAYQQRAARYYNKKVKLRRFEVGDLVLKRVTQSTKPKNTGPLGPTWEGPYRVREILRLGTYILESLAGRKVQHPWNAEQLRRYYQ